MKKFYLKNYKVIHHILNLGFFILFLEIIGFDEIFTSTPFTLMILLINYFIVKFSLKKSGLDKEIEKIMRAIEDEENI